MLWVDFYQNNSFIYSGRPYCQSCENEIVCSLFQRRVRKKIIKNQRTSLNNLTNARQKKCLFVKSQPDESKKKARLCKKNKNKTICLKKRFLEKLVALQPTMYGILYKKPLQNFLNSIVISVVVTEYFASLPDEIKEWH